MGAMMARARRPRQIEVKRPWVGDFATLFAKRRALQLTDDLTSYV